MSVYQPEDPHGSGVEVRPSGSGYERGFEAGEAAGYQKAIEDVAWYLRIEVEKALEEPRSTICKITALELSRKADAIEAGRHLEDGDE